MAHRIWNLLVDSGMIAESFYGSASMKKLLLVCVFSILAACATPNPLEEANIQTDVIYKFTNPTLSTSLYVKLLPPDGEKNELLFKTARNDETVNSLEVDATGVFLQKYYQVGPRGKINFRHFQEGLFESLLRYHQYAGSGGQQENIAMFRYRLDFRKASRQE